MSSNSELMNSPQGGTYDDRNNVEQVLVNTPTPGASISLGSKSIPNAAPAGKWHTIVADPNGPLSGNILLE